MKIIGNYYNYNNSNYTNIRTAPAINKAVLRPNYDTVSFGVKVNYGITAHLSKEYQAKVASIHRSIGEIKEFFNQYKNKNSPLASKIKKSFPDLIQRKHSGYAFKLPDSNNTLVVMQGQSKTNLMWIYIEDGSKFNGIVMDGNDKLVANVSPNHPHMLPRELHYMNEERLKEADPEKFIDLAFEKISKYHYYISKIKADKANLPKSAEKPAEIIRREKKTVKPKKAASAKKSQNIQKPAEKLTDDDLKELFDKNLKTSVRKIMKLFTLKPEEFPEYIKAKLSPQGQALGFSINTTDGGILKVAKITNKKYGEAMQYLSFERINPDKSLNYISVDLPTYSILRTQDKAKPLVTFNDNIYYVNHMSWTEIKRRKFPDKLETYMNEIFRKQDLNPPKKSAKVQNKSNEIAEEIAAEKSVQQKSETESVVTTNGEMPNITRQEDTALKQTQEIPNISPNNVTDFTENFSTAIKTKMETLAKKDATEAANIYFNTFIEQFKKEIMQKVSSMQIKFEELIKNL